MSSNSLLTCRTSFRAPRLSTDNFVLNANTGDHLFLNPKAQALMVQADRSEFQIRLLADPKKKQCPMPVESVVGWVARATGKR